MTLTQAGGPRRMVSLALTVVAVALAVTFMIRDQNALRALSQVDVLVIVPVLGLQVANIVTDSVRYRMALPRQHRAVVPWWSWHRLFGLGRLLNSFVPQAGMAYRAAQLKLEYSIPIATFVGSVAAITWLGNGLALVLAAAVLYGAAAPLAASIVLFFGLAILAVVGLLPRMSLRSPRLVARLPARVSRLGRSFAEAFVELARTPGRLTRVVVVSGVTQVAGAASFVLLTAGLGVPEALKVGVALYASVTIVTVVSLTPGGLGIAELAAGLAGSALDIGAGVAILITLASRFTSMIALLGLTSTAALMSRSPAPRPNAR